MLRLWAASRAGTACLSCWMPARRALLHHFLLLCYVPGDCRYRYPENESRHIYGCPVCIWRADAKSTG